MLTRLLTLRRIALLAGALIAIVALAAACSGGGDEGTPDEDRRVLTPVTARYLPQTVSSDVAVGPNRFLVGLIDQETDLPALGAELHFRFFLLDGNQGTLKSEADATAIQVTRSYTHTHADGTIETHEAGEVGVYAATVEFDTAGDWGIEVSGKVDGADMEPVTATFSVRERSESPAVGEPAPRSVQAILSDVEEIADIDTSDPPNLEMHNLTIADAVTSGKPTVVVFATPAYCVSQICGPTKEIVDQLYGQYAEEANFVHVEPYVVPRVRAGDCASLFECRVPAVDEWGLRSEPWVFLVDDAGDVAAKFEAMVTYEELETALLALMSGASGDTRY